jgi:hypothetical protein
MTRQILELTFGGHQWLERKGRHVEIESGEALQLYCVRCGREFLTVLPSGSRYAVPSIVSFFRLNDDVTARWLSEPCPSQHLQSDDDQKRKLAEIPSVWNAAHASNRPA